MFKRYGFLSTVNHVVEMDIPDFKNRFLLCATILDFYENKQQLFPST